MADEQRKTDELEQLIAELNELCQEGCSCPCELDGPAKSNDSAYRTRHIGKCQFAEFVRKVYAAGIRSVLQEIVAGMEKDAIEHHEYCDLDGSGATHCGSILDEMAAQLRSTYGVTAGKENE
jgi:hypothetical protein